MKSPKSVKTKLSLRSSGRPLEEPNREEIAAAAYSIWEQEGRPEGRDLEHWLRAKTQVQIKHDLTAPASSLLPQKGVINTTANRKRL